ncbi:MAG: hypothetical protein A2W85_10540 [Bacteroidetes bacterium GWF2_41_31]|nr:MAG: hypothetical protein A2W85_10540 [Bacteroidetes bacterium GWF2_41_31]
MNLLKRIEAFARLGYLMQESGNAGNQPSFKGAEEQRAFEELQFEICDAPHYNGWFTEPMVRKAISSLGKSMTMENLEKWLKPYLKHLAEINENQSIGLVMAGNIPAVGFHDLLCVLITGNKLKAKLSSDDNRLIPALTKLLVAIEPGFADSVMFTNDRLNGFNAIIATGSNNSARYFEYYFGKYPHIIRKNRNGVAVLTGKESQDELQLLCSDIFSYYGLGCRNVSHLYVPREYDFVPLLDACQQWVAVNDNHKYFNNYEYNKAIFLVNSTAHFDAGNLLVTESASLASAVSVLHYEYYSNVDGLQKKLEVLQDQIQCVVAADSLFDFSIPFGKSQEPQLWDYADGIDTIGFLMGLK